MHIPFLPHDIEHPFVSRDALPSSESRIYHGKIVKSAMMNMPKKRRLWVMEQAVYTMYHEIFAFTDGLVYYQSHNTEFLYHAEYEMS